MLFFIRFFTKELNNHIAFVFAVVCDVLARAAAARDTVSAARAEVQRRITTTFLSSSRR